MPTRSPSRSVTAAEVVAFRAARHHLDRLLPAARLHEAAAVASVQNTPPGNAHLSFAARVDGMAPGALDEAVEHDRILVAAWSLRGAPHVIPVDDLGVFTCGLLSPDGDGVVPRTSVEVAREQVMAVLAEHGPLTRAGLSEALHGRLPKSLEPYCPVCEVDHVPEALIRATAATGAIVFCELGTKARLVLTERWLAPRAVPSADDKKWRLELLRRFLAAFGPASPEHFAAWAGVDPAGAEARWGALRKELAPVLVDGKERWVLAADDSAALTRVRAARDTCRFLPAGDPFLAQRDRELLVPDKAVRKRLWLSGGSPGLVLADAAAAALWRPRKRGRHLVLTLQPITPLSAKVLRAATKEAERIAAHRGCETAEVQVEP